MSYDGNAFMSYDAIAVTEALRELDLAAQHLRHLVPHWPEVRPGDLADVEGVIAALHTVDAANARVLAVFTRQVGSSADYGEE